MDADTDALDAMVRQSSVCNTAFGITGMLWFDGNNFAQVLEGDHARIDEIMARIEADGRHTDLEIVVDREAKDRAFGAWGMTRPDDSPESLASTAFLTGISMAQPGRIARRLYDIVAACEL